MCSSISSIMLLEVGIPSYSRGFLRNGLKAIVMAVSSWEFADLALEEDG